MLPALNWMYDYSLCILDWRVVWCLDQYQTLSVVAHTFCVSVCFCALRKSARRDEGGRRDIVYNCFAIRPCLFRDMCPYFRRAEVHTAHINACDDSVNPNRLYSPTPSPSGSWNCLAPLSCSWPANKKKTKTRRSIGQNIIAVVCVPVAFLGSECLAAAAYFLSTRAVSQPARCVTCISATSPYFGPKAVSPTDMCAFLRVFRSCCFFCQLLFLLIDLFSLVSTWLLNVIGQPCLETLHLQRVLTLTQALTRRSDCCGVTPLFG